MQSPAFRLDIVNNQTGMVLKSIPLDYALADPLFDEWPLDADARSVVPTPTGWPLEIRIRRIL